MGEVYRVGDSYRASFISCLGSAMLGLVPGTRPPQATIRLVTLPLHKGDDPAAVDGERVREVVLQAQRDVTARTGRTIPIEAIEYVPNDAPRYDVYRRLANQLLDAIAEEP